MIDENKVSELANLSRIELTAGETAALTAALQAEVQKNSIVKNADLTAVEPLISPFDQPAQMRPDQVGGSLAPERTFQNSAQVEQDHFVVPKIMG